MKIYYIAVSSWDGRAYTFDFNEFFFSEQERDAVYEKLRHNADFDVRKGEEALPEVFDTIAFQKGVKEGKRLMMEGAVEGEVCILPGNVAYVTEKNNESLKQYLLDNFKTGDKVGIIILPKEVER